jgi:hypothetical protein
MTLVQDLADDEPLKATLQTTIEKLMTKYEEMSNQYHTEKSTNECNSLAFG